MTSKRRTVVIVIVAIVVAILLSIKIWDHGRNEYWWGVSDGTQSLLSHPLADATFEGLKLVDTQTHGHIPVGSWTKSRMPYVYRWFSTDGISLNEAFNRVIESARSDGWSEYKDTRTDKSWVGKKQSLDRPYFDMVIVNIDTYDTVDQPVGGELVVRLIPG